MQFGRLASNTAGVGRVTLTRRADDGRQERSTSPTIGGERIHRPLRSAWVSGNTNTYTPYIVLGVSANPTTIKINQTSTITANLSKDNNGATVTDLAVFTGQPVTFGNATRGTITPHL